MKQRLILMTVLLGALLLTTNGYAQGPWVGTIRGGGQLNFNGSGEYQVAESRLHWNLKVDQEGVFNGHVSIMEKLMDGSKRNFHLTKHDLETLDTLVDPGSSFECSTRSVQVIGFTNGEKIVVAFNESKHSINYQVTDRNKVLGDAGYFISSTDMSLELDGRMTLDCTGTEGSPESPILEVGWTTPNMRKIFLPTMLR